MAAPGSAYLIRHPWLVVLRFLHKRIAFHEMSPSRLQRQTRPPVVVRFNRSNFVFLGAVKPGDAQVHATLFQSRIIMNKIKTSAIAACAFTLLLQGANAFEATYALPLNLATEAATEAIRSCEASGFRVSVAVLDLAGQATVQLKGDASTPHTSETAYRKAYTVVTLARNYGLDTSQQVATLFSKNAALYSAALTIPNMTPLPGAVAIKVGGNYFGALGVSGAPGGDKDEACALAGVSRIFERLPK